MTEKDIFCALGEVDAEFIEEAAPENDIKHKSRHKISKWILLAACVAALVAVTVFPIMKTERASEVGLTPTGGESNFDHSKESGYNVITSENEESDFTSDTPPSGGYHDSESGVILSTPIIDDEPVSDGKTDDSSDSWEEIPRTTVFEFDTSALYELKNIDVTDKEAVKAFLDKSLSKNSKKPTDAQYEYTVNMLKNEGERIVLPLIDGEIPKNLIINDEKIFFFYHNIGNRACYFEYIFEPELEERTVNRLNILNGGKTEVLSNGIEVLYRMTCENGQASYNVNEHSYIVYLRVDGVLVNCRYSDSDVFINGNEIENYFDNTFALKDILN